MYEWDEAKRQRNLRKHGVDFVEMERFNWAVSVVFEGLRERYFEQRWLASGPIGDVGYALAFTEPEDGVIRVISLRRATTRETRLYAKEIRKTHH
ncbi:MAG: BrnT family toxin [Micropepsaceae bacterium]